MGSNLKISPRLGAAGIGGHLGILLVWFLKSGLGLEPGPEEIASIVVITGFLAGWAIKE